MKIQTYQLKLIDQAKTWFEDEQYVDYSCREIADKLGLSYFYFIRIFTALCGQTPLQYRNTVRIKRACYKLSHTCLSISNISAHLGFSSQSSFSHLFRMKEGLTPTKYRKQNKGSISKIDYSCFSQVRK